MALKLQSNRLVLGKRSVAIPRKFAIELQKFGFVLDRRYVLPSIDTKNYRKKRRLWKKQKGKCIYCNCDTYIYHYGIYAHDAATVEHIVPSSKGGSNHPSNLAIACDKCNSSRGNEDLKKFINDNFEDAATVLYRIMNR